MYPPSRHLSDENASLSRTIKEFPLATLISAKESETFVSDIPLLYRPSKKHFGYLRGHMDRFNPHCGLLDGQKIKAVFHGPDCYISPAVYTTQQLPTWNYVKIHLEGTVKLKNDPEFLKKLLIDMSRIFEDEPIPFMLDEGDPRLNKLLPYVVGFEIEITAWKGRIKLSQDKIATDREKAMGKLIKVAKRDLSAYLWNLLPQ